MPNTRTIVSKKATNTLSVRETLTNAADTTVTTLSPAVDLGRSWDFDGVTGPAVTAIYHGLVTLTAGAATLDLTAIVDALSGLTTDLTGKKLRMLWLKATTGNAGAITFKPHASDGYTGWIGSGGEVLSAGDYRGPNVYTGGIAVDATHKILHITGTGTDSLQVVMFFGT